MPTPSTMLPLNTIAPDFRLPNYNPLAGYSIDELVTLHNHRGKIATIIMFICNHCPYVIHLKAALSQFARDFTSDDVKFIAINSNDITTYPDDSPEHMTAFAKAAEFNFPYLFDETQAIARAYQAACTPDFYIFDSSLRCAYRGRFDGATPKNNVAITGSDLRNALAALLQGKQPNPEQQASLGCNIKWKS